MKLIGLTGGIASGKSVVGARLAELGAVHIDADLLAREVVAPGTPGLAAIAAKFGADVIAADGTLDRPALGAIVFSDRDKLAILNDITHPAVRELTRQRIAQAGLTHPDGVAVYDVALLVENFSANPYDLVVVTHAGEQTRIGRMVTLRGMDPAEAARRIASQASEEDRLAIADVVIDTDGTLEQTIEQVDRLWESLTVPA